MSGCRAETKRNRRLNEIALDGALALGVSAATVSVLAMLTVTGLHENVPTLPEVWVEWHEVFEYGASILLAFVSGYDSGHVDPADPCQYIPNVVVSKP